MDSGRAAGTAAPDIWSQLELLRGELIDQLEPLPEELWNRPSLCGRWRVRDVVAHLVLPERFSGLGGLLDLIRARFSLSRMIEQDALARGSAPLPELIAEYRAGIARHSTPPGRSPRNVLADLVVHAQDIRRPLLLPWNYPAEVLLEVLATISADQALGVPGRLRGLRVEVPRLGWGTGGGALVSGPAEAVILALTGRPAGLADLSGPGVKALAERIG